jgi:CMP-N-acetylneuraminic acid synthetase
MKLICLIPARNNSQRFKNKNFKLLKNLPLINHTINFAQKINSFKKIIVSTDSRKILSLKKKYKNIVFLKRPSKFSNSTTLMKEVVKHAINSLQINKSEYEAIAILQPTSPLRTLKTIDKAIKIFKKKKPDYLATVRRLRHTEHPYMIISSNKKKIFSKKFNFLINNKRNKLNFYSLDGGVIFILNINNKSYELKGKGEFLEINFPETIDIDYKEDFELAKKFI